MKKISKRIWRMIYTGTNKHTHRKILAKIKNYEIVDMPVSFWVSV